jgi:hypothetical protein
MVVRAKCSALGGQETIESPLFSFFKNRFSVWKNGFKCEYSMILYGFVNTVRTVCPVSYLTDQRHPVSPLGPYSKKENKKNKSSSLTLHSLIHCHLVTNFYHIQTLPLSFLLRDLCNLLLSPSFVGRLLQFMC